MPIDTLSIVIPVYNEVDTITNILDKISEVNLLNNIGKEIIVVDDASTDGTDIKILDYIKRMKEAGIQYEKHTSNRGKGAAIRTGI